MSIFLCFLQEESFFPNFSLEQYTEMKYNNRNHRSAFVCPDSTCGFPNPKKGWGRPFSILFHKEVEMKKTKAFATLILALAMIIPCLAACDIENQSNDTTAAITEAIPSSDPAVTTEKPEESTAEATKTPEITTTPETTPAHEATTVPEVTTEPDATTEPEVTTAETPVVTEPPHTHSFASAWSITSTLHWHECSCGEKADTADHSFGEWAVTKEATCTAKGSKKRVCSVCGYEDVASIDKLAHTPIADEAIAPTCTQTGKTAGSHCSVCNAVITAQQIVPATGHSYGDWSVTKDATCTAKGQKVRTCTACSATDTQEIAALGHDYVDTVVPPTVTAEGYTDHICSRCNDAYRDSIVEATGSLGLAYRDNGDGTCTIIGIGTCQDTEIFMPRKINGLTVIGIDEKAFENQTAITAIHLFEPFASIGNRSFAGCTSLKSINIPASVTQIGTQPFFNSGIETVDYASTVGFAPSDAIFAGTPLKEIVFSGETVPDGICYNCGSLEKVRFSNDIERIGNNAFENCTGLSSVVLPQKLKAIGGASFRHCNSLLQIDCPQGLKEIGGDAFVECTGLQTVNLNEGLEGIYSWAFYGCSNLVNVSLPSTLTRLADGAFIGCAIENVVIPSGITVIEGSAFYGCDKLKTVQLPNTLTSITIQAFNGCSSLETIAIPEGVTYVGTAFYGCESLVSISLPESLTSMDGEAFAYCTNLSTINYNGTKALWNLMSRGADWDSNTGNYIIHCTDGDIAKEG